ncbi:MULTISPECIES: hypothetical protein [Dyadobacter]|uniref:Uncharacterized protein n=1 Tax=Dyadobacter chenhuakuii TaxID=2909339 RepID=A0ABY4XLF2_9BACT|nr:MULTISPECIES: hypothetical protein [Dyadobacter]MCE7071223.1 hypothetical protein [Dyadobacter sp. CY327]MCF2493889.1 hypothetical protein [Dyadobacter chenhuakuii]USJ31020.1 hypothetical protein NFI80_24585 [Dyadobacter chenhuakuii]
MKTTLLRNLSLGYLLLPNLIFSLGWFRLPLSVMLALAIICIFVYNYRLEKNNLAELSSKQLVQISVISLLIIAFSGIGGFCFQAFDYWAHNSKYYTLFNHSWPVLFKANGRYACHYFGFFLVPALISKMLGELSGIALYLWASLGLFLGFCWIFIFTGKSYLSLVLFLSLGGIGHLVKVVTLRLIGLNYHVPPFFTEIWPVLYQAQWAPNQLIPIIIVSSILFHDYVYLKKPERSFLAVIAIFIWGIFPSIVFVIIFSMLILLRYGRDIKAFFQRQVLIDILVPGLIFIPTFFYFLSGKSSVIAGFIWQFNPLNEIAFHYFFGVVIDLGVLIGIVFILNLHKNINRDIIVALFTLLILISLVRMGKWNDWFLRGNTPVLTLLSLFILQGFSTWIKEHPHWYKQKVAYPLMIFLLLGLVVPMSQIRRALQENVVTSMLFPDKVKFTPYPYNQFEDFYELGLSIYSQQEANQFLGQKGSIYELYLAR